MTMRAGDGIGLQQGSGAGERLAGWTGLQRELHDLCQPLTALQCMLELATVTGDEKWVRFVLDGGLKETQRMFAVVANMRERLQEMRAQDVD